jgi:parallel beta-helix repeat protein
MPVAALVAAALFSVPAQAAPEISADIGALQQVADGARDATPALQAALQHGIVTLPPGTYRITRPLEVRSNQGIIGPGVLLIDFDSKKPDATNAALHAEGTNLRFEGFTIQKKFVDGSYGVGILAASGSKNIVIRNLDISGYSARYGIHLQEVENFEITSCYIHDFMVNVAADMIEDSPAGIRVTRCKWGVVSNNRLSRIEVGPEGLLSISPFRPAYGPQKYQSDHMTIMQSAYVSITGNVMQVSGEGIDMLLSSYCTLSGNIIRDIWNQGVKMLGVSHCTVTGNSLLDCFQGVGLDGHKQLGQPATGNVVTGNSILFNTDVAGAGKLFTSKVNNKDIYGVQFRVESFGNLVANNVIQDLSSTSTVLRAAMSPHNSSNLVINNQDAATTQTAVDTNSH